MAKKLDRKRPFGEIYGGDSDVRFNQDGLDFDVDGDEIVAPVKASAKAPAKASAKAAPAPAPVEQGVDAQLAEQTKDFQE